MTRALVAFVAFNALLLASLSIAGLYIGADTLELRAATAAVFLIGEMFIVGGTISPAIVEWMADE